MLALRSLLMGVLWASAWPLYLAAAAQVARLGPWPKSTSVLAATILNAAAIGLFARGLGSWFFKPGGWCERYLDTPPSVTRQFRGAGRLLVVAATALLVPIHIFANGEVAHQGTVVTAPALSRFLFLAFELIVVASLAYHLRPGSALMSWINPDCPTDLAEAGSDAAGAAPTPSNGTTVVATPRAFGAMGQAWVTWSCRRARAIARLIVAFGVLVVVLDFRGYSFAAGRLAVGGVETLVVFAIAWATHRVLTRLIAWRLRADVRTNRLWASAASYLTARAKGARAAGAAPGERPAEAPDLMLNASRASTVAVVLLALGMLGWIWGIDPALLDFLAKQHVWSDAEGRSVVIGDLATSLAAVVTGGVAWRYMAALFAFTLFRKMPDDPGVRFAVVTLCRYAILAATLLVALESVHLKLAQISFILAALGVGLGFGLQEVVSNFICGLILLLERPIRIGDVVSVGGTTGKVDRINTRSTTIINGDNQCMIVPNRELITGKLVNWTHKDKIMRVGVRVVVAHDSDVEDVTDLLLTIAKNDFDVLSKPAPSALLEDLAESGMVFGLSVYVADPGLMGGAKHRICKAIRERFAQSKIALAGPPREVTVAGGPDELVRLISGRRHRGDGAGPAGQPHRAEARAGVDD
ncbi:mechanosensitive ion channel family protein [Paludisphaera mucosa]|uniref:Mechanosensitive ion channel n=1 Tax=Paludisphaera mucosa TaxID=3030827 RepID=A0ABT6FKT5_9BACT|nr:mechanosensitive ion channel domain-containing protein [Paludisphaera mucosa]MDG3008005.1 mechanosensitive ion channel [Paludisphaera mucosa]